MRILVIWGVMLHCIRDILKDCCFRRECLKVKVTPSIQISGATYAVMDALHSRIPPLCTVYLIFIHRFFFGGVGGGGG